VLVDQTQQVILRNLIFQAEIVEQRFRAGVLPHHDQQTSANRDVWQDVHLCRLYRNLPADHSDFFNTHPCFQQLSNAHIQW